MGVGTAAGIDLNHSNYNYYHHQHYSQKQHADERRQPLVSGELGSGHSERAAGSRRGHRRAGGNLLCGSLVRWRALAWESLFGFLGALRTGRLRVSPACQMRVEVSVRAGWCGAGWNQGELAGSAGLLTLTALKYPPKT